MPRKEITVHAPVTPKNDLDGDSSNAATLAQEALSAMNGDSADYTPGTISMGASLGSDDVWLSVKQASEYTGKKKMQITKAISAGKLNARTRIVHEDYAPLTEISKTQLDIWNAPKAPKVKVEHAGARATRGGQARRWLLYVPDSQIEGVKEALKPFGVEPTTAYRSKKQKDAAVLAYANAEPNPETQAANLTQTEMIAPLIDQSTPVENDAPALASTSDELELVEA